MSNNLNNSLHKISCGLDSRFRAWLAGGFLVVSEILLLMVLSSGAVAWDAVAHRMSVAVAVEHIDADTRKKMLEILEAHPRYETDFLDEMPRYVRYWNEAGRELWLLGQAAFWPDTARRSAGETRRCNANWHYINSRQGNVYINNAVPRSGAGQGNPNIPCQAKDENIEYIVSALEHNSRLLANSNLAMPERAVALCWVLHLIGDIHQPLHSGSLFSAGLFPDSDFGGNRIPVVLSGGGNSATRNLHQAWDRALRQDGVSASLKAIRANGNLQFNAAATDWQQWLAESEQLLTEVVYNEDIRQAIIRADKSGGKLEEIELDGDYVALMKQVAQQRLALAGLRMAAWLNNELP
ncbi:MAG: S1/P1 nuclease [Pseudohongiellaceae bacterium]